MKKLIFIKASINNLVKLHLLPFTTLGLVVYYVP